MTRDELIELLEWYESEYPECDYVIREIKKDIIEHFNKNQRNCMDEQETNMEHKYKYYLNGKLYFIVLNDDEVERFRIRYGLNLIKAD